MIMPFRTQNLTKHLIRENQRQIIGWISVLAHQPVISQYLKSKKEMRLMLNCTINDDKELFRNLLLHKDEIESVMGLVLDWRELPERKASRIIIEKEVTFDNRATWSQQFDYIMDVCMKMKKAFKKYL
mgnify:FL=1